MGGPKQVEQSATRVERAAVAEEVASALRHEVRNKLASIQNALFFVRRRVQGTEVWQREAKLALFFDLMKDQVEGIEALLRERASFTHLLGRDVERTRVGAAVVDAVESLGALVRAAGVEVERRLDDGADVNADQAELALMVRCLVENAVEALPEGGRVVVATRDEDADGGRVVVLEVTDAGPGLEEGASRALEPFSSSRPGHLGVGLNIAKRVAERYGGTLVVGPDGGPGTRVEVRIPVAVDGEVEA